jgi:hypothetical protein
MDGRTRRDCVGDDANTSRRAHDIPHCAGRRVEFQANPARVRVNAGRA